MNPGHEVARQAFDVMMGRGWGIGHMTCEEAGRWRWYVDFHDADTSFEFGNQPHGNSFDDPFTALVGADKWMKEAGK